jgi:hypothetical protein
MGARKVIEVAQNEIREFDDLRGIRNVVVVNPKRIQSEEYRNYRGDDHDENERSDTDDRILF